MQKLEILFEDEVVIVINKPSGVPSHTLPSSIDTPTIESLLIAERGVDQVFLAHRLDTGTSGVLLFAKDPKTYNALRELFKLKQIRKWYRAWSTHVTTPGFPLPLEITYPLAHHPKSKKRMVALLDGKKISHRGNAIAAHSRILDIQPTEWSGQAVSELRVEIITGVMHQIRVHLKQVGYPLIGDAIYNKNEGAHQKGLGETRLGLHAEKIQFELGGFNYEIEAPLPT